MRILTIMRVRAICLTLACLWLFFFGTAARGIGQNHRIEQLEQDVERIQNRQERNAINIETRLTKLETQVAIMGTTLDRLVWGTVGSVGLFLAQALWGVVLNARQYQKYQKAKPRNDTDD